MINRDPSRSIDRLLGPAHPEVSCDDCFELLDAYVDRQILHGDAEEAMPAVTAHLNGCPACAEDHHSLQTFITGHTATDEEASATPHPHN